MPIEFPPRKLKNEILRYMFDRGYSIKVSYLNYVTGYPGFIFPEGPLNSSDGTYFQTFLNAGVEGHYGLKLSNPILLSHFSIEIRQIQNYIPYPDNWRLVGCLNDKCNNIAKEPYEASLNTKSIKKFSVAPGI